MGVPDFSGQPGIIKTGTLFFIGLANNLLNQKAMECATAAAMPGKIPSEKQSIYLVNLLKRLELEGLRLSDG